MATGDHICQTCHQYQCVCGAVLSNLFSGKYSNLPLQYKTNQEKRIQLLDEIEQIGCACDSVGYSCGIHNKIRDLKQLLSGTDISMLN